MSRGRRGTFITIRIIRLSSTQLVLHQPSTGISSATTVVGVGHSNTFDHVTFVVIVITVKKDDSSRIDSVLN